MIWQKPDSAKSCRLTNPLGFTRLTNMTMKVLSVFAEGWNGHIFFRFPADTSVIQRQGGSEMNPVNDWNKVVEFHGHSCVGLALGCRAGQTALKHLNSTRSPDEELIAIVETDNCALDALQVLTGCSMGKGNIFFRDYGKNVFTIGRRDTGQAVRIAVQTLDRILDKGFQQVRTRVMAGTANDGEKQRYHELMDEEIQRILDAPEEVLFKIEAVDLDFPAKARIFSSVTCSICGEAMMEPRARLRGGKPVCIPCSDHYSSRI